MIFYIIIFLLSISLAFGMLIFVIWEIKNNKRPLGNNGISLPKLPFRHIEKNMLYLAKHIIQGLVLVVVKYWLVSIIKIKKIIIKNSPKIHRLLRRKPKTEKSKMSFAKRAILESKFKIKKMKEKIKEEL